MTKLRWHDVLPSTKAFARCKDIVSASMTFVVRLGEFHYETMPCCERVFNLVDKWWDNFSDEQKMKILDDEIEETQKRLSVLLENKERQQKNGQAETVC
jgi:hypothetical protein